MRAFLSSCLNVIQSDSSRTGLALLEATFPAILAAISNQAPPLQKLDEAVELTLVQITFVGFNCSQETRRGDFVAVIVPPLCDWLVLQLQAGGGAAIESKQVVLFVGKGMTLLARTSPDAFRDVVTSVGDVQRQALQVVMRLVLQQQANEATSASATAATAPPAVKKIDMSRYKA